MGRLEKVLSTKFNRNPEQVFDIKPIREIKNEMSNAYVWMNLVYNSLNLFTSYLWYFLSKQDSSKN